MIKAGVEGRNIQRNTDKQKTEVKIRRKKSSGRGCDTNVPEIWVGGGATLDCSVDSHLLQAFGDVASLGLSIVAVADEAKSVDVISVDGHVHLDKISGFGGRGAVIEARVPRRYGLCLLKRRKKPNENIYSKSIEMQSRRGKETPELKIEKKKQLGKIVGFGSHGKILCLLVFHISYSI